MNNSILNDRCITSVLYEKHVHQLILITIWFNYQITKRIISRSERDGH